MARRRGGGGGKSDTPHPGRSFCGVSQPERRRACRSRPDEGAAMKLRAKLLVLPFLCTQLAFGREAAKTSEPKWRIDLRDKYQFEAFDRDITFRWTLHQDVLFL